jgi:hypothetical protein
MKNIINFIKTYWQISIGVICLIIAIFLTIYINTNVKFKLNQAINNLSIANDSITTYKNKKGELVSEISVLQTEKTKDFIKIQSQDTQIKELQQLIKSKEKEGKEVQMALILANNTFLDYQDSIENLIVGYELKLGDTNKVKYPIYNRKIDMFKNWATGNVRIGISTFDIKLTTRDSLEITFGTKKEHWYSKPITYADVINKNPLTTTNSMRAYNKQEANKKVGLKMGITGLMGLVLGIWLIK